jgi:hypothetical protein
LDLKYRSIKPRIGALLEKQADWEYFANFQVLAEKTTAINNYVSNRGLTERLALFADLVHMQLNRTFRVKQRQQELIVYYFLQKYLASVIAKKNKTVQAG